MSNASPAPTAAARPFADSAGIAMHPGTRHEFPLALEPDTRITILLRAAAPAIDARDCAQAADAAGPDLERWDIAARMRLRICRPDSGRS